MKFNFCTLFDSYYLTRGLTLYNSLVENCKNFHIYIFTFDENCYSLLQNLKLKNATLISLKEFENEELLKVKSVRTIAEYCWTCTPSIIWYSVLNFNLDHCSYVDADMMFFSSPNLIFEAIGDNSVGITPHNFSLKFKSSEIYGKYCVQFVYIKNDKDGMKVLDWWRKSCLEWCFAKLEDNKYGDQKYLDNFKNLSDRIYEITNYGVGLAPWNIDNFQIERNDDKILISKKSNSNRIRLILYHFQGLRFKSTGRSVIAEASPMTKIPDIVENLIYLPYIKNLIKVHSQITKDQDYPENILFTRSIKSVAISSIKEFFRRFSFLMKIYFFFLEKRYNRPKGIGSEL